MRLWTVIATGSIPDAAAVANVQRDDSESPTGGFCDACGAPLECLDFRIETTPGEYDVVCNWECALLVCAAIVAGGEYEGQDANPRIRVEVCDL